MKTQVKTVNPEILPAFSTQKVKHKSQKLSPSTLFMLSRFSEAGQIYSVVARPILINCLKDKTRYVIKISDNTYEMQVLSSFHTQTEWLHRIRQGQYFQFILHCRQSINKQEKQFYFEKVNQITNFNQISYSLIKIMYSIKTM